MSTQTVTRSQAPEATTIPHETDLHIKLAELLANAQPYVARPSADPTRDAVLEGLSDLPGMDPALQEFYARVLPRGAAPVACRPFWPCA
jgi:hypothetical protein